MPDRFSLRVNTIADGVHLVSWSGPPERESSGDVVVVEVERADLRWCAVADIHFDGGRDAFPSALVELVRAYADRLRPVAPRG